VKRLAACSALSGALFLLTGCTVSIAQQPPSDDETIALTEPSPAPASPQNTAAPNDAMTVEKPASDETIPPTEPSPAPASPQNTAPPTDAMTVEKPASECKALAGKPCRNKKAEAGRASMAARKVEARRKAEADRKAAEQRKAEAAALHRLTEERKAREARIAARLIKERQAEEARKADAAHAQLEASRSEAPPYIADKFKRAFERGRSAWLNAQ